MGKLKEAHANNDKISAVRVGKAYLAGTAKEVWVPDPKTQEWRDWFHAYSKATKRTTQMQARLRSYLSDNGVRLKQGTCLTKTEEVEPLIRQAREWSVRQLQVIAILLAELRHASQQRQHWHSLIAQEVLAQPELLSIVRLCGIREIVAFALGAFVGDIGSSGIFWWFFIGDSEAWDARSQEYISDSAGRIRRRPLLKRKNMQLDHRGSAGQIVGRGSSRAGAKNGRSVECLASFGQGFGAWTSRRGSGEHAPAGALRT